MLNCPLQQLLELAAIGFVINTKRGCDQRLHTLVAVQVSLASTLTSKREAVLVERSLQRSGTDRAKVDRTFCNRASRNKGRNPHGQTITVHEGHVIEIQALILTQRKFSQSDRGGTLGVTVNHQLPIEEWSTYRASAFKATRTGANITVLGCGLAEVTVAPTPDTTGPGVRNVEPPDGPASGFPSKRGLLSEDRVNDEGLDTDPVLGPVLLPSVYIYEQR